MARRHRVGRTAAAPPSTGWDAAVRYLPALGRAAVVTFVLSCLSMALAVTAGVLIASGRVYGPLAGSHAFDRVGRTDSRHAAPAAAVRSLFRPSRSSSSCLRSSPRSIGLGLNYAAYESEIYRGALEAVPTGQLDAARTLGLSERQTLVLVRGPQAFRLALAPMTNDFVALLKDSSLVSVITVVELTKETSIFAANIGSWLLPGAMCAAMYLALSLPSGKAGETARKRMEAIDARS